MSELDELEEYAYPEFPSYRKQISTKLLRAGKKQMVAVREHALNIPLWKRQLKGYFSKADKV